MAICELLSEEQGVMLVCVKKSIVGDALASEFSAELRQYGAWPDTRTIALYMPSALTLDLSGITSLVESYTALSKAGKKLGLFAPSDGLRKLLERQRVSAIFEMYDNPIDLVAKEIASLERKPGTGYSVN